MNVQYIGSLNGVRFYPYLYCRRRTLPKSLMTGWLREGGGPIEQFNSSTTRRGIQRDRQSETFTPVVRSLRVSKMIYLIDRQTEREKKKKRICTNSCSLFVYTDTSYILLVWMSRPEQEKTFNGKWWVTVTMSKSVISTFETKVFSSESLLLIDKCYWVPNSLSRSSVWIRSP